MQAATRLAKPTALPSRGKYVGAEPEGGGIELQGFGWQNSFGGGHGAHTISSGLEGAWTQTPATWDNEYLKNLFSYEWELTKSPAGANQWTPKDGAAASTVPDAHDPSKRHAPIMFTTDLALRMDPNYEPIARRFYENPQEFAEAFAKAWYKLTHRDMGPLSRYLGPLVPAESQLWQDPVPAVDHELIGEAGHCRAEGQDPRHPACRFPIWSRPPGRRRRPSAAPTSAAGQTGRAFASRRKRIGK